MALKYGSPEYAGLTAKLATGAGQAIKRERARQEQAQAAQQQAQIAAQRPLAGVH